MNLEEDQQTNANKQTLEPRTEASQEMPEILRKSIDEDFDLVIYRDPKPRYPKDPLFRDLERRWIKIFIQDKNGNNIVNFEDTVALKEPLSIYASEEFQARDHQYLVGVPIEELSDMRNIFLLLHEIGHVVCRDRNPEKDDKDVALMRAGFKRLTNEGIDAILQEEAEAWAEAIKLPARLKEISKLNYLSYLKVMIVLFIGREEI